MADISYDQQSEMAVLSLAMKNPKLIDLVPHLSPKMFSSIPNKNVYSALLSIYRGGLVPEYSLVISYLHNKNLLGICGGEGYILWLYKQNYDESNFQEFVSHVVHFYKTKELFSIGSKLATEANSDVDETISWLKNKLNDLGGNVLETTVSLDSASQDMYRQLIEKINSGERIITSTGFKDLDYSTGGYGNGELWIIAGRPGMGKSAYMCNSVLTGTPSLVFSLEMNRIAVVQRLISIKSGIPIFDMRLGNLNQKQIELVNKTIEEIKDLPVYIDTSFAITTSEMLSKIKQYKEEKGVKVVYLDYVQLLIERSNNATHDIGKVSRDLKLLANDLGVTAVLFSQLNRLVEGREDKRPILSDLRQSGNLEEDADIAMFLYRDVVYNPGVKNKGSMEFIIRKQRNGPIGTLFMDFSDVTNKITEAK